MDETDAFFTQTIVGSPLTVLLGRRQAQTTTSDEGLRVELQRGPSRLSQTWQEWAVLSHACDPVGQPRLRPGPVRRWLERRALLIALSGLLALLGTVVFWGTRAWS